MTFVVFNNKTALSCGQSGFFVLLQHEKKEVHIIDFSPAITTRHSIPASKQK